VVRAGKRVSGPASLTAIRARAQAQLASLDGSVRRLVHPHEYPVGLTPELHKQRAQLVAKARAVKEEI
jgi:nicotinate phosphoribosyltransferase